MGGVAKSPQIERQEADIFQKRDYSLRATTLFQTTKLRGNTKKRVLIYYEDATIKVVCFLDEAIWGIKVNVR